MAGQSTGTETGAPSGVGTEEDHSERRTWWRIVAVGLVVFIAVIMFGKPLIEGRLTAARNLDRATAMIAGTNGELEKIDAAVRASGIAGGASTGETAAAVSATRSTLAQASELSQSGYDRLTSDEQERALLVRATAVARIESLDAAQAVLSAGDGGGSESDGARALADYERAIDKVREADTALVKL